MTLSLHSLLVAANRLAVLTTTHGAAHAVADLLVGRLVRMTKPGRHAMHSASILFVLLCAIGAIACHRKAAAEAALTADEPPIAVEVVEAVAAPTPDILTLTGTLAGEQRAEVTADTQGKVLAVMVQLGQRVQRGQPVVKLDVAGAAMHTREAYAQLETARADQRFAEAECERARKLHAAGIISTSEAERLATQCTSAGHQVNAAQARSAAAGKAVVDGLVRAPFDGIVAERSITAGEWVAPGRALFTLIDADPLLLELRVPETHIHAIALGQRVELSTVAQPKATYHATITRIGAEIGRTRALTVEATVDRDPKLVPGMFVEARVIVGHTLRPVLPASAVAQRGTSWHAFVVRNNSLEERIVQLGPTPRQDAVSIVQSIAAGERVVRTVTEQTVDGLRVK